MRKSTRLLLGLLLLFAMGALAVQKRAASVRQAYGIRHELERQAELENAVKLVEGEVLARQRTGVLLRRATVLGLNPGRRFGRAIVAPEPSPAGGQ